MRIHIPKWLTLRLPVSRTRHDNAVSDLARRLEAVRRERDEMVTEADRFMQRVQGLHITHTESGDFEMRYVLNRELLRGLGRDDSGMRLLAYQCGRYVEAELCRNRFHIESERHRYRTFPTPSSPGEPAAREKGCGP